MSQHILSPKTKQKVAIQNNAEFFTVKLVFAEPIPVKFRQLTYQRANKYANTIPQYLIRLLLKRTPPQSYSYA